MGGSNPETQRNQEITINLSRMATSLSDSIKGARGSIRVSSKGKVDGDNNSFVVNLEFIGNKITQIFKGTISDCEINFSREGGRGDS